MPGEGEKKEASAAGGKARPLLGPREKGSRRKLATSRIKDEKACPDTSGNRKGS